MKIIFIFYTRLYNKINIHDYFFCKGIQEKGNICIYTKKMETNEDKNNLEINVIKYSKNSKYEIMKNKTSSSFIEEGNKSCIFNISNLKGNEELYLTYKNKYNIEEIEEDHSYSVYFR